MKILPQDMNTALMLDGNAIGGLLNEIFSMEMTSSMAQCNHCGNRGELGTLLAFLHGSDAVLRCPICDSIVMRIVQSPESNFQDLRGATFLSMPRVVG